MVPFWTLLVVGAIAVLALAWANVAVELYRRKSEKYDRLVALLMPERFSAEMHLDFGQTGDDDDGDDDGIIERETHI